MRNLFEEGFAFDKSVGEEIGYQNGDQQLVREDNQSHRD